MWHSHCTRVSSLFWRNAVTKCSSLDPLLWLQMQVAKVGSELLIVLLLAFVVSQ